MNHEIIAQLKTQSTWRLIGLSIITYCIYPAHYIRRQTRIINQYHPDEGKIPDAFVIMILFFSYLSVALLVGYLFVDESHPVAKISNAVDRIGNILFIIWGFMARNRMNQILAAEKTSQEWFHGLWTLLFSPFYFNFKINQLYKNSE